jgi:hypothetical protein
MSTLRQRSSATHHKSHSRCVSLALVASLLASAYHLQHSMSSELRQGTPCTRSWDPVPQKSASHECESKSYEPTPALSAKAALASKYSLGYVLSQQRWPVYADASETERASFARLRFASASQGLLRLLFSSPSARRSAQSKSLVYRPVLLSPGNEHSAGYVFHVRQ